MTQELKPLLACPFCGVSVGLFVQGTGIRTATHPTNDCVLSGKWIPEKYWSVRPIEAALEAQVATLTDVANEDLIRLTELQAQVAELTEEIMDIQHGFNIQQTAAISSSEKLSDMHTRLKEVVGEIDLLAENSTTRGDRLRYEISAGKLRSAFPEVLDTEAERRKYGKPIKDEMISDDEVEAE